MIKANQTYTASYLAPSGRYSVTNHYPFPATYGPLTALKGVYKYGGGYPTDVYQRSNYFVDVLFTASTVPPLISATSTRLSATPVTTISSPPSISSATATTGVQSSASSTTSLPPTTSSWPTAANTGVPAGTVLVPSGPLTITTSGQVIDRRDITGGVVVQASNVVRKKSRIRGAGSYGVLIASGSLQIQDSEILGFENGIAFDNWKAYRVEISGQADDGAKLGSNVTLQDSWIHDLNPSAGAHADGAQLQSGEVNVIVRHNTIDLGSTIGANAALFLAPDLGPSSSGPLVIDNNKLKGGNFSLYCVDGNNGRYFIRNISITNNRFGRAYQYGPANINVPVSQSGNMWDDTGTSIRL